MRKAEVKLYDTTAGWLTQNEAGYHFEYDTDYQNEPDAEPVSLVF